MLILEDIFNQHQADNYILTCNQANVPIYAHKTNKERDVFLLRLKLSHTLGYVLCSTLKTNLPQV